MIGRVIGHTVTILTHKWWVFYYAFKLGIPFRGLFHDLSKFSPVEFWESVQYYQGGKKSPIPVCKQDKGWSKAWLHHKGHNPHHYEYWTDNYDQGTVCIKIPYKYVLEMVADYMAAGRTYCGKKFTYRSEYEWWEGRRNLVSIHPETVHLITYILLDIVDIGPQAPLYKWRYVGKKYKDMYERGDMKFMGRT